MPPQPPSDPSEKRLIRAAKHVSLHWFPINPVVLSTLKNGFQNGSFTTGVEPLLLLLKKDFALFTFVTKELIAVAEKRGAPIEIRGNPIELIRWAGTDEIEAIIMNEGAIPFTHQLNSGEDFQNALLRETVLVASTAEVLSEEKQLDPNMGFCRGVVREIGLNLIAWNYPTLYARVLKQLTPRLSLDEHLTEELGFSPLTLAMHILKPAIKMSAAEEAKLEQTWAVYDQLCTIGEALAHASNPDAYPTAENDWKMAHEFITEAVGEGGFALIRHRAVQHAKEYSAILPGTFEDLPRFDPEERLQSHKRGSRALDNHYLKQCPPHVQAALRTLYSEMPRTSVSKNALEKLIKEIIPNSGFTGGCVFVVDPATLALTPRTIIGQVILRPIRKVALKTAPGSGSNALISETILSAAGSSADLAASAFACTHPLLERTDSLQEGALAGIYSSLGSRARIGVLYLELPEKQLNDPEARSLQLFKALRQTLCDVLMVE